MSFSCLLSSDSPSSSGLGGSGGFLLRGGSLVGLGLGGSSGFVGGGLWGNQPVSEGIRGTREASEI